MSWKMYPSQILQESVMFPIPVFPDSAVPLGYRIITSCAIRWRNTRWNIHIRWLTNSDAKLLYYLTVLDQIIANLTSMKNSVDSKEIDALISDIFRYEKVSAFGYLQSENVALNLQYDLQTSRKIIFTCMQFADQIEHIRNADEKELIIVFSELSANVIVNLLPLMQFIGAVALLVIDVLSNTS